MLGLLKLNEFASQRGEGLLPELLELLTKRTSADALADGTATQRSNIAPRPQTTNSSALLAEGAKDDRAA